MLHKAAAFEDGAGPTGAADGESIPIASGGAPAPATPQPKEQPIRAPSASPGADEGELMDALFEAADFEDKVPTPKTSVVPGTGAVPGTGRMPTTGGTRRTGGTAGLVLESDGEQTKPMGGEIGVDWSAATSHKPPDDEDFVTPPWRPSKKQVLIGVGVILLLLLVSTVLALSLGGGSDRARPPSPPVADGRGVTVERLPVTRSEPPEAPEDVAKYWAPVRPGELQRVADILAALPAITVGVSVIGPGEASETFSLAVMDQTIDYSMMRIEDSKGQRLAVNQLEHDIVDLFKTTLAQELAQRGFTPELKEIFEEAALRVTIRLEPVWSLPNSGPPREGFADHSMLPCGMDVIVSDVTMARDAESLRLVGDVGPYVVSPQPFPVSRSACVVGGAPEMGEPENSRLRVAGLVRYSDLDLLGPARSAASWAASLVCNPDRDWNAIWDPENSEIPVEQALRGVFATAGAIFMAEVLRMHPDRVSPTLDVALNEVIGDVGTPCEWLRTFVDTKPPYSELAVRRLADRRDAYSVETFQRCLANADDFPPETVRACACALLDMGQFSSELSQVVESGIVKDFPNVCRTESLITSDESVKRPVLDWMLEKGCPRQRLIAAVLVLAEKREDLRPAAEEMLSSSLIAPGSAFGEVFSDLWTKGIMDFDLYSMVAVNCLAQSSVGDVPVELPASAPKLEHAGIVRLSDLVSSALVKCGGRNAAPALVRLLDSPSVFTQVSAMRGVFALDYVDAAPRLRERYVALTEVANSKTKTLNPFEKVELEALSKGTTHLSRFETKMLGIEGLVKQGNLKKAEAEIKKIVDEKPGSDVARRALAMLEEARNAQPPATP
jgi:hypothetical protein